MRTVISHLPQSYITRFEPHQIFANPTQSGRRGAQPILLFSRAYRQTVVNAFWFLKAGEVVFLMCLVAFVSVKSTTANSSLFRIVSLGQYLVLVAWEMLICYFGEIISLNSQRCGEALLRSPWHLHATEMKTDVLIFLLNARESFKLSAGRIYVLNVDLFKAIMTMAFSFLTFLKEMDV